MGKKISDKKIYRQVKGLVYLFVFIFTIFSFNVITFGNTELQYIRQITYPLLYMDIKEIPHYVLLKQVLFGTVCFIMLYCSYRLKKATQTNKQLTALLKKTQTRYDELAEQSRTFTWEVNELGVYTYVSALAEKILGYSPEEMIGKMHFCECCLSEERDSFKSSGFEMMHNKKPIINLEKQQVAKDHQVIWLLANGIPIFDKQGHIKGYSGTAADITERKKIQEEIKYKVTFQKIIADLSKDSINTSMENIDDTINKMLKVIGEFFRADRSYLYLYSADKGYYRNTHEWCEKGISPVMKQMQYVIADGYPWWREQLERNKPFFCFDIDNLPLEASKEKEEFKRQHIQSLLCIPILIAENSLYFLGVDFTQQKKYFSEEAIDFLVILSNLLGDRLRKYEMEKHLILTKEQLQLAFYQAQIGPHFLYNALSTIAIFCDSDPQLASALVLDLSLYLRRSFDFKNLDTFISLEKEIELIKAYINIEKARFGKRLKVIYDIDLNSKELLIPPLVIQPLVENAIHHGLMKRIAGGTLKIKVKSLRNKCIIQVIDNGIGMEKSIIDQLYSTESRSAALKQLNGSARTGVGLRNIHMRLRKLYNCGLIIKSSHSYGTKISLSLPIHQKGSE
jgi:PAS domain S-box-containing protein